jgi:hypothetical protein
MVSWALALCQKSGAAASFSNRAISFSLLDMSKTLHIASEAVFNLGQFIL